MSAALRRMLGTDRLDLARVAAWLAALTLAPSALLKILDAPAGAAELHSLTEVMASRSVQLSAAAIELLLA